MTLEEGDSVIVTNKDGETTDGEVTAILSETVSERTVEFSDEYDVLLDYWSEVDVSGNEQVISVDLGGAEYDYPASRVEVDDNE